MTLRCGRVVVFTFIFIAFSQRARAQGYDTRVAPFVKEAAQKVDIGARAMQQRVKASAHPRFAATDAATERFDALTRAARHFYLELRENGAKPYLAVNAFDRLEKAYFDALAYLPYLGSPTFFYETLANLDTSMAWLSYYYGFRYGPGYASPRQEPQAPAAFEERPKGSPPANQSRRGGEASRSK